QVPQRRWRSALQWWMSPQRGDCLQAIRCASNAQALGLQWIANCRASGQAFVIPFGVRWKRNLSRRRPMKMILSAALVLGLMTAVQAGEGGTGRKGGKGAHKPNREQILKRFDA